MRWCEHGWPCDLVPRCLCLRPGHHRDLPDLCERFGLRKSLVVEQALRSKIEDLLDAHDLEEAQRTAVGFRSWDDVERELRESDKL